MQLLGVFPVTGWSGWTPETFSSAVFQSSDWSSVSRYSFLGQTQENVFTFMLKLTQYVPNFNTYQPFGVPVKTHISETQLQDSELVLVVSGLRLFAPSTKDRVKLTMLG